MKRGSLCLLTIMSILLCSMSAARADDDNEREELKSRFKERYPTLVKLKRAGTVGETHQALVDAVKREFLEQKVDPGAEDSLTVKAFLELENKDRRRLYVLLAEELDTTPEKVAHRNAVRNFERAGPEEFLKPKEGPWVRKKDLEEKDTDEARGEKNQ